MHNTEARRLSNLLSPLRLAEYEVRCGGDPVAALRLHCWNTEISEAFYGPLQYLELAMRSTMTRELVTRFGRDDWWDAPGSRLNYIGQQRVTEAETKLRRTGQNPPPHMITEELPFGFYVSLLGSGNDYERLWRSALHKAFPGYRGLRRHLHRKVDHLRIFRNKIAHHGPIHHRHLAADHDAILECLHFIDAGLAKMVERHSRVSEVLARRP
ncbi:Abi family protein [Nonomuraea ceibae]|uniref:Abi family protein n=1 Tax=Nonomuraea ceibae TaxID=1935170 RepID=UPI001C5F4D0C|nr:Abi family protein [Nonomuraea ceibae]